MIVGFKALEERCGLQLVQPLRIVSTIGPVREHQEGLDGTLSQYPPSYKPSDDFPGHFEFGLKYEELHLEFLARLFRAMDPSDIEEWCRREPTGQYSRRTGFFYEWLTGARLNLPDVSKGSYVPAIPSDKYMVRTTPIRCRRWRVNDNLPGTRSFCPLIRLDPKLQEATSFDTAKALDDLDHRFGAELLLRSSNWLSLKESRASFQIEHEENRLDRIQRFASVIAEHCGKIDAPLEDSGLKTLQAGILGKDSPGPKGLRQSPIFVGQATVHEDIVHYVAPHFEVVPELLAGLRLFESATRGAPPLLRAGAISFGFVYIHPLRDGNGRIHRFLVSDVLQRDHAIPDPVILPISASLTRSLRMRAEYERALEAFSRPFMRRYASACRFAESTVAPDGTSTNFVFDAYEEALPAWRYPDLTEQVTHVAHLVAHTITVELAEEVRALQTLQTALARLKEVVELPDPEGTRLIRSLKGIEWNISGKLVKEFPWLADDSLANRVVEAIRSAFAAGVNSM